MTTNSFRLGTLGSELTFAGQAADAYCAAHPGLETSAYFPTMDAVADAVTEGKIDGGLLTSETSNTACTETFTRILRGDRLFVAAEVVVPYRCALLGKPGTRLADIRHVGGHGSLKQCTRFLAAELPQATVEIHRQNSVAAAREVLDGDGTTAVVGTEASAARLGLEILARNVDDGAAGAWWILTAELRPDPAATHLALLVSGSGRLAAVLRDAPGRGLRLRTVTNAPTGELFCYRYLVVLAADGPLPVTRETTSSFSSELVGAFTSTTYTERF